MYTFTFSMPLPSTMSLQQAQQFFDEFNSKVNGLVIATEDAANEDLPVSTYILDADGVPVY